MPRNLGGQKRTVHMPCGKIITGHPRDANSRTLLHHKYCSVCSTTDYKPSSFDNNGNDASNVKVSRHGNPGKEDDKVLRVVSSKNNLSIRVDGATSAEQAIQMLQERVDELKNA
jgi:hypothetical protein